MEASEGQSMEAEGQSVEEAAIGGKQGVVRSGRLWFVQHSFVHTSCLFISILSKQGNAHFQKHPLDSSFLSFRNTPEVREMACLP